MQLKRKEIDYLLQEEEHLSSSNLNCFQYTYPSDDFNFYIFTCNFKSAEELMLNYSDINELIAFDFQRNLERDIEKWNLYIFYFIEEESSEELRTLIEQDKYATRKIVFDKIPENFSAENTELLIVNKLFDLNINTIIRDPLQKKWGIKQIIEENDKGLILALKDINKIKTGNSKDGRKKKLNIINSYLELKKYE